MSWNARFVALAIFVAGLTLKSPRAGAQAFTYKVLANFTRASGLDPLDTLVADNQGDLFGTTAFGGASNDGTVFELPAGSNTPIALASFNGANGANPIGGLVMDKQGNLFGTATLGGREFEGSRLRGAGRRKCDYGSGQFQ